MNAHVRSAVATRITLVGLFVNVLLTISKIIVGVCANSLALIADGIHSLTDMVSDIFILISFQFSKKPADKDHNYGHAKADVVAEVLLSMVLFFVAFNMIKQGITSLWNYKELKLTSPSMIALAMAAISTVVKEGLYQYTMHYAKILKLRVLEANAFHHRTDSFSSVAVLIGLTIAKIFGGMWGLLDPALAIVIAFYIMKIGFDIFKKATYDLTDGSVSEGDFNEILKILSEIEEIKDPHNVRTRRIGSNMAVEMHVRVNPKLSVKEAHDITRTIENKIRYRFGKETFISVHVEPFKVTVEEWNI